MMKKFNNQWYEAPECVSEPVCCGDALLADSYNYGGGGTYSDGDIIDNGSY